MLEETARSAWEYGREFLLQGKVADYIPELGKANPVYLGLCIMTPDGARIEYGDTEQRFTLLCCGAVNQFRLHHSPRFRPLRPQYPPE